MISRDTYKRAETDVGLRRYVTNVSGRSLSDVVPICLCDNATEGRVKLMCEPLKNCAYLCAGKRLEISLGCYFQHMAKQNSEANIPRPLDFCLLFLVIGKLEAFNFFVIIKILSAIWGGGGYGRLDGLVSLVPTNKTKRCPFERKRGVLLQGKKMFGPNLSRLTGRLN